MYSNCVMRLSYPHVRIQFSMYLYFQIKDGLPKKTLSTSSQYDYRLSATVYACKNGLMIVENYNIMVIQRNQ